MIIRVSHSCTTSSWDMEHPLPVPFQNFSGFCHFSPRIKSFVKHVLTPQNDFGTPKSTWQMDIKFWDWPKSSNPLQEKFSQNPVFKAMWITVCQCWINTKLAFLVNIAHIGYNRPFNWSHSQPSGNSECKPPNCLSPYIWLVLANVASVLENYSSPK